MSPYFLRLFKTVFQLPPRLQVELPDLLFIWTQGTVQSFTAEQNLWGGHAVCPVSLSRPSATHSVFFLTGLSSLGSIQTLDFHFVAF